MSYNAGVQLLLRGQPAEALAFLEPAARAGVSPQHLVWVPGWLREGLGVQTPKGDYNSL